MDKKMRTRKRDASSNRKSARLPDHLLWLWRRGDPIPRVASGLTARFEPVIDDDELARVGGISVDEIQARRRRGNRPYEARVEGELAGYGWACHGTAECGWRNLPFTVRDGDCYLWDFATLPRWRGNGLYPRLLAWILRREEPINRYWIMHNQDNQASRRGIARAGFRLAAALYDLADGRFLVAPLAEPPVPHLVTVAFADLLGELSDRNRYAA